MGQYASTVNAFAQDEAYVKVYNAKRQYQSYGQTAYMLNVSTNKFRNDIAKKAVKYIAQLEKKRVVQLQQELARLQAKQTA